MYVFYVCMYCPKHPNFVPLNKTKGRVKISDYITKSQVFKGKIC